MEKTSELARRIIVALDVKSKDDALHLVKQLDQAEIFKVGLRLFISEGPPLLKKIMESGKKIFLDLKLHDIPNTVAEAIRAGVRHGVHMMTLHTSGGREMLARASEAAVDEAEKEGRVKSLLLGVTVLTSLKSEALKELGILDDVEAQVLRLAKMARDEGMDGIVCSPLEIDVIKKEIGKDFTVVIPGIRPSWAVAHDQKRITTPSQAIQKGADYLVVGRPILEASSPQEAFWRILDELNRPGNSSYSKN